MSALLQPLPPDDQSYEVIAMLTLTHAVDLYLGDLQRRGYSRRTLRTYREHLAKHVDDIPTSYDVSDVKPDDVRRTLDRNTGLAQGTVALAYSILNGFYRWLYVQDRVRRNPLDKIERPKRIPPEDLDVITVSTADVRRMLAAGQTWTEKLAVAIPAYLGPRRHATALLRLRDYDLERKRIRFREKGGKTIWKPVPDELAGMITAALADGVYNKTAAPGSMRPSGHSAVAPVLAGASGFGCEAVGVGNEPSTGAAASLDPDAYLIPPEGPLARPGDRDDRVIWRVVKRVAARAGVEAHVHALRAAFAVFYLESNPGHVEGLQALMGHRSIATTQTYLRKLSRQVAMEQVRGLSYGFTQSREGSDSFVPFGASPVVGAGGFEPPFAETPHKHRRIREQTTESIDDALLDAVRETSDRVPEET